MDDDLDDLLNEVESKYCATKESADGSKKTALATQKTAHTVNKSETSGNANRAKPKDDLNSMIDDIFDDSNPDPDPVTLKKSHPERIRSSSKRTEPSSGVSGTAKCFPVSIGGTSYDKGISTAVNQRTCDKLRCTDCDFNVEMFDNVCWHPDTDYLFLRNNIPDYNKLKVKLLKRSGWRAYACQCKSKSVEDRIELQETNLKWVCGKH